MLKLDEILLIGKGNIRSCYKDPTNDDRCIKIVHTGGIRAQLRTLREIRYIKKR